MLVFRKTQQIIILFGLNGFLLSNVSHYSNWKDRSLQLTSLDQLNTTIHGTMRTSLYELVFRQPARQNIFPGVRGGKIFEEELEDLIETDEKEKQNLLKLSDQSDNTKEDEADSETIPQFSR